MNDTHDSDRQIENFPAGIGVSRYPAVMSTHDLLTSTQVAEHLQISERTLYRLIDAGTIPDVPRFGHSRAWDADSVRQAEEGVTAHRRECSKLYDIAVRLIDPHATLRGELPPTASNLLSGKSQMIDARTLAEALGISLESLRDFLKVNGRKPHLRPDCKVGGKLQFSMATVVEWLRAVKARKWAESLVAGEQQ